MTLSQKKRMSSNRQPYVSESYKIYNLSLFKGENTTLNKRPCVELVITVIYYSMLNCLNSERTKLRLRANIRYHNIKMLPFRFYHIVISNIDYVYNRLLKMIFNNYVKVITQLLIIKHKNLRSNKTYFYLQRQCSGYKSG